MAKVKVAKPVFDSLTQEHGLWWKENHPGCQDESAFLNMVCNSAVILPQKKQGYLVHYPCHNVQPDEAMFEEVTYGWQAGKDYLLILPAPAVADIAGQLGLTTGDRVSAFVREELVEAGIPLDKCMVTYACRFSLPTGVTSYNSGHKKSCAPYVQNDVRNLRPKVIITFGTDALKALLGDEGKIGTYRGSVATWAGYPIVMTQTPKEFMTGYGGIEVFRDELLRAKAIAEGTYVEAKLPTDNYRTITTLADLRQLVADIEAANPRRVAFDFEFGSLVKRDEHTIVRSCQVAWAAGHAAFIMLRKERGEHIYSMAEYDEAVRLLGCILQGPWQLAGHHLRTDINRAWYLGINIDDKLETGFCTMLAYHLLYGDDDIGLDQVCRRLLPEAGAYWRDLELWLDRNERKKQLAYGYLMIPDEILIPYGLTDADAAWRIADILENQLQNTGRLWELFTKISMPTALHIMDLERKGITVDEKKRMEIRSIVEPEYKDVLAEFKELIRWPDCPKELPPGVEPWPNFTATGAQVSSLLYGVEYKDKKPLPQVFIDGSVETVQCLGLVPPFNTDKYPRDWTDIEDKGENHLHKPSTKAPAIELLAIQNPDLIQLKYLKWLSVLGKYLNTYLSPQLVDPETNLPAPGKSFAANICDDGRVRTNIAQTSETGRWRSFGPNLQTNPKKQEAALKEVFVYRRFGGMSLGQYEYRCKKDLKDPAHKDHALWIPPEQRIHLPAFKEVYIAKPGHCLIEADFATAEIAIWAYVSGDETLIGILDQGRDMHCEVATSCFNLPIKDELEAALAALNNGDTSLYKKWSKNCKDVYGNLRTVAKCIIFGVIYGRGARALAREINKQGVETTEEQCQATIDGIAKKFPKAWAWLMAKQKQAEEEELVENVFGFRRYFTGFSKMARDVQAKMKRQGPNSGIQGCVDFSSLVTTLDGSRRFVEMPIHTHARIQTGVSPRDAIVVDSGIKDTVTVYLGNGANLRLTPDHRVLTLSEQGPVWKPAGELLPGSDLVPFTPPPSVSTGPVVVDVCAHVKGELQQLSVPVDARFAFALGYSVGDGYVATSQRGESYMVLWAALASEDWCLTEIKDWLTSLGVDVSDTLVREGDSRRKPMRRICSRRRVVYELMQATGLASGTHAVAQVPNVIWRSASDVQLAFLDGYFSADGTVTPKGEVTYVTKSRQLAHDVSNLLAFNGLSSRLFQDGKGYWRGGMSRAFSLRFRELRGFQYHRRKADWLAARGRVRTRVGGVSLRYPVWFSRTLLPDRFPKNESAGALYSAVRRGAHGIGRAALEKYADEGFKDPGNVEIVSEVAPSGDCRVADLSVITDKEEERRFVANGFTVHNCVAQLLCQAGVNLYRFRYRTSHGKRLKFDPILPIHDAYLVETPLESFKETQAVIRLCMSKKNVIPLTGGRTLGVDITGEPLASWGDH